MSPVPRGYDPANPSRALCRPGLAAPGLLQTQAPHGTLARGQPHPSNAHTGHAMPRHSPCLSELPSPAVRREPAQFPQHPTTSRPSHESPEVSLSGTSHVLLPKVVLDRAGELDATPVLESCYGTDCGKMHRARLRPVSPVMRVRSASACDPLAAWTIDSPPLGILIKESSVARCRLLDW